MEVSFDNKGNPLLGVGKKAGVVISSVKKNNVPIETSVDTSAIGNYRIAIWGDDNLLPQKNIENYLRKAGVLRSAIDYKVRLAMGQGIFPCKINDYDANGNEILAPVTNVKLRKFLRGPMVRAYLYHAFLNLYEHGNVFAQIILNADNNKVAFVKNIDAPYCRFTQKEDGVIKNCVITGTWEKSLTEKDVTVLSTLDVNISDEFLVDFAKKHTSFIYPINLHTTGNIYYALPSWDTARQAGWLDISLSVPGFLKAMFENQMSIKYHIKIPYAYWDKKYPRNVYTDEKKRSDLIQADLDELEEEFTKPENARKAFITHFEINPSGAAEEKWEIEVLDDKFTTDQYLPQSAAANSEILFSERINPSVMGAGMPGGPYAGNSGSGSDIREAFLVNLAQVWIDRQLVLDPLELAIKINFPEEEDVELRFMNTILTTLDTGGGTTKKLS